MVYVQQDHSRGSFQNYVCVSTNYKPLNALLTNLWSSLIFPFNPLAPNAYIVALTNSRKQTSITPTYFDVRRWGDFQRTP